MPALPGVPQLLRVINDRAALELLVERGPLSRTEVGQLTGLSHPTATRLLARLERAGLVIPAGTQEGGRGPSSQLYAMNPAAAHVAAVDVTPAAIEVAVADITGTVVATHRLPRTVRVPGTTADRVRAAVHGATARLGLDVDGLAQVTIGTPGSFHPDTGRLTYAHHLPGWHRPGLPAEIRAALGVETIIDNDVNLAALAELDRGVARGCPNFAMFWMGTGLGLAVVMDGALRRGAYGGAGEISYLPVAGLAPNRHLREGAHGGFESTAGTAAVVALGTRLGIPGRGAAAVLRAARAGGTRGQELLRELATRVATGLAAVACLLEPELIVVSGAVGLAGGAEFVDLVVAELAAITIVTPRVELSTIEDNPVLAGARLTALKAARERLFHGTAALDPGDRP